MVDKCSRRSRSWSLLISCMMMSKSYNLSELSVLSLIKRALVVNKIIKQV